MTLEVVLTLRKNTKMWFQFQNPPISISNTRLFPISNTVNTVDLHLVDGTTIFQKVNLQENIKSNVVSGLIKDILLTKRFLKSFEYMFC